ncbi:cytochrome P450 [Streptomyces sp. B6B3]|uniref:cytochrome P450 n=1 Tax=Streptomyces sp. B6B3 TaxID=3153570 RepID=UPI00325F2571
MKPGYLTKYRDELDPLPDLHLLTAASPMAKEDEESNTWFALGRDEVRTVLSDASFSNLPAAGDSDPPRVPRPEPGNPLQWDGTEHGRLRRMLGRELSPRRVRAMTPLLREMVTEQLDVLEAAGQPADLMRYFAWPLAGRVCSLLFGLPRDDMAELARHAAIRTLRVGQKQTASAKAYGNWVHRMLAAKRREPGDDLLGRLVREHGDAITDEELMGLFSSILFSELEGMTHMTGAGVLALLRHPDQLALLRERPELMDHAVEELIRYASVIPFASPRNVVEDVRLGGRTIRAGDVVHCSLFAANRSQPPGEPPDGLDVTQDSTNHLAFGHGAHFCIGATLARAQLRTSLEGLLRHFPTLRLGVAPDAIRYRVHSPQHGIESLPIAW